MFPAEKEGEFEPYKIRRKQDQPAATNGESKDESQEDKKPAEGDDEVVWEEDRVSEEGAIWPIQQGRIVDWPCFFALITHTYNSLNPPFHTPILLITQPAWTPREHEKITQFFFEKFKVPAFGLMDAALATTWAYGVHTATVIDVGKDKADITAVSEFIPHTQGRVISLEGCGGEAFTQGLLSKLKSKGLNRDMCEQLKRSPICELLPPGVPLPGPGDASTKDAATNPAALASTGATGPGAAAAASIGNVPRGPGIDTEVGEDMSLEESEGVLDVASIVAGGKMSEYLAKKEREKQEKANAKKKGGPAPQANKPVRLPNSRLEKATFLYEDHALLDTLKNMNLNTQEMADAKGALDEGPNRKGQENGETGEPTSTTEVNGTGESGATGKRTGSIRREIEVGTERFMADGDGTLEKIADAVHRAISSIDEVGKRSDLWEQLIVCGNGSKLRGKF
jgi:actin-related protein 9